MSLVKRLAENTVLAALTVSTVLGDLGKSGILNLRDFSSSTNIPSVLRPNEDINLERKLIIDYATIGYFLDENRNGKRDYGEFSNFLPFMTVQNIPPEAVVGVFIPEDKCWGKKFRVIFRDTYTDAILLNQSLDCSDKNSSNSYKGKPLGVFTFKPRHFREGILNSINRVKFNTSNGINKVDPEELISGKRLYSFECIVEQDFGKGVVIGRGNFYIEYKEDKVESPSEK